MSSAPSEFQIIKQYFEGVGEVDSQVIHLGIGDDCSVITPPEDKSLCFSLDTMVEGRHFPTGISSEKLATRAMGAALSDLAAMGAIPSFFTLSLTLQESNSTWLEGFSRGLKLMADEYQLCLVGGDTTRGPLTVGIQVHGFVQRGMELRRSGALPGDVMVVTGSLGDAGAALELLGKNMISESEEYLLQRYYRPIPRFKEAGVIRACANACIDISDGLLADARHIADASRCGLQIDLNALPISPALREFAGDKAFGFALNSGDDYELLFTLSEKDWVELSQKAGSDKFTEIGRVVAEREGVRVYSGEQEISVESEGFKHFE